MQDEQMTPMQLVLRGVSRDVARVDLIENSGGRAPLSFEDVSHGVRVPRLGTPELVAIAQQVLDETDRGGAYMMGTFEIAGPDMKLLRDHKQEAAVSKALLKALKKQGTPAVFGLLNHEYRGYTVAGIRFYKPGAQVTTVRRNGVVLSGGNEGVVDLIRRAWNKVNLW